MPNIYTARTPPNYISLRVFQDALNEKAMAVLDPDKDLGHAALTMKTAHISTAHIISYTNPSAPEHLQPIQVQPQALVFLHVSARG